MILAIFEDDRVCITHMMYKFESEAVKVVPITSAEELHSGIHAVVLDWWVPHSWEAHRDAILCKATQLAIPKCIYTASPKYMIAHFLGSDIHIVEKCGDHAKLLEWIRQLPAHT